MQNSFWLRSEIQSTMKITFPVPSFRSEGTESGVIALMASPAEVGRRWYNKRGRSLLKQEVQKGEGTMRSNIGTQIYPRRGSAGIPGVE